MTSYVLEAHSVGGVAAYRERAAEYRAGARTARLSWERLQMRRLAKFYEALVMASETR